MSKIYVVKGISPNKLECPIHWGGEGVTHKEMVLEALSESSVCDRTSETYIICETKKELHEAECQYDEFQFAHSYGDYYLHKDDLESLDSIECELLAFEVGNLSYAECETLALDGDYNALMSASACEVEVCAKYFVGIANKEIWGE